MITSFLSNFRFSHASVALVVAFVVLHECPRVHAQGQTISGDLGVTGSLDVSGETFNLGAWTTDANKPGLGATYTEDTNHVATLTLSMTRPVSAWLWQQASSSGGTVYEPQMSLGFNNTLTLFDLASPTRNAAIILNPTGTSSFAAPTEFDGTVNRMPNQTAADAASVLTMGIADSRYLVNNGANSLTIGSGANVNNHTASLAIGNGATTAGDNTSAVGAGATAGGANSAAYGNGAASGGYDSTALGASSSSAGDYSTALGYVANASAPSSLAFGVGAQALSTNAAALGNSTTASGYDAAAFGFFAYAEGTCSVALGNYAHAVGNLSTALGYSTQATGTLAAALGGYSAANNTYATALSAYSAASGYSSVALGFGSVASGDNSTTLGEASGAGGANSAALGFHSSASGQCSVALGNYSSATGTYATSLATNSVANGDYSASAGNTTASAYASFVVGSRNLGGGDPHTWVATDPLFEVGNGPPSTGSPNSDALVVYKNGNMTVQGVINAAPGGDIPMYTGN